MYQSLYETSSLPQVCDSITYLGISESLNSESSRVNVLISLIANIRGLVRQDDKTNCLRYLCPTGKPRQLGVTLKHIKPEAAIAGYAQEKVFEKSFKAGNGPPPSDMVG